MLRMKYAIGLDIGIASVGYAVLALDHEENPWGIIRLGSRIFDVAENPKDGASLAFHVVKPAASADACADIIIVWSV